MLVSARLRTGDAAGVSWLSSLGWSRSLARLVALGGLDEEGVRDVLRKMGNPLDTLAANFDLVAKLHA